MYEDYPGVDYWEIYVEVYGRGERSATGMNRMISNRLKWLQETDDNQERKNIIEEINELVWHLYENFKQNQKKLEKIRNVLKE